MQPSDLETYLQRRPFRPFRMHLLEKSVFDVRHPELVVLKLTSLELYVANPEGQANNVGNVVTLSLLHITKLEFLPIA